MPTRPEITFRYRTCRSRRNPHSHQGARRKHTAAAMVASAFTRGIPIGGVNTPGEVLRTDHFVQSGAFVDAEIAPESPHQFLTATKE